MKLRADLYAALALSALACGSPFEAPMCTYTTTDVYSFRNGDGTLSDGTNVLAATPVECQCKATYTCACLESTVTMPGELCPTGEVFFECDNSTGVPIVYCEIP